MSSSIGGHAGSVTVETVPERGEGVGESQVLKVWESHVKKPTINETMAALTLGSERNRRDAVPRTGGVRPVLDSEARWEAGLVDLARTTGHTTAWA